MQIYSSYLLIPTDPLPSSYSTQSTVLGHRSRTLGSLLSITIYYHTHSYSNYSFLASISMHESALSSFPSSLRVHPFPSNPSTSVYRSPVLTDYCILQAFVNFFAVLLFASAAASLLLFLDHSSPEDSHYFSMSNYLSKFSDYLYFGLA